ncbi:MAG: efflux RND transporter permease subunit [Nitrospirae bacterium]|nr:efflux RND transporter permease subunit [Nitrospirota bacterium]MDE3221303.1 efflux RND transporter permease subunit [Nitrospirota bacterium]
MVRAALKNPFAVIAISLIVIIIGVVSYQKMVVDIFPEINMPVVAVATFYKGMGPSEVEGAITLRLEQAFLQASYIDHIESRSLPGVSLIKVYFHSSYDVNAGLAEITSLTYANLRYLPQGIFPPVIIKFGAASLPIAVQTTSSEAMTEKEVRDLAYFNVRPQLGNVPGVAFPTTFGGTVRQVTVFLDPERMLARGVSTHEIVNSVNMQSVLLPAGDVKIGDFDYNVYTNSMIKVVDQMNDIPIKMVNGVPVFLRDVGKAVDSTGIQTNVVRINGNRAVYLPILKQAGANTIAVIDGIKDALTKLIGIPQELSVKLLFDQSLYIRQAIHTLEDEGLLGGGLACLMVLLFLGSLRYTLIIAMAIPLSVTAAFIGLYFTGHSVNIMTLGGLALAVGRLVDDAIVVVENTHRHMDMGKSAKDAAGDAVTEVALPMLVITITVFLVFLPIAFFTGIIKFLFVPLALTVAYAMMASYLVALTVAPVSIAWLFRKGGHGEPGHQAPPQSGLIAWWNRMNLFDPFVERYVIMLRWCLGHKAVVIVTVTIIFVGSLFMAPRLATEFFPKVDAGSFILNLSAPEGTRIEKTEAIVSKVEGLVREAIPAEELDQIVSNIGLPQGWMVLYTPVNGPHQAYLLVSLKRDHEVRTDDVIVKLRQTLRREFPGLKFSFQTGGIVSDVINSGLPAPIDIKVSGPKMGDLAATANKVRDLVAAIPGTADVQVRQGVDYPEIHLDVNRAKASYVGLNEYQIVTDLVTGLSSNITLNPGYWIDPRTNNAYFVVTQFAEQILQEFEDFLNMPLVGAHVDQPMSASVGGSALRGSSLVLTQTPFPERPHLPGVTPTGGSPVLLRDLVDVVRKVGPETVDHFNLQRTMDVLVSVPGNDLGRIATQIEEAVAKLEIPKDVVLTFKGEVDSMRAAISGFAGTLPLAMVLIYLVMVGLFRSWLDPFVVMFAVPLGFIGVIWMLLLTHTSLNVESLIGTLMMIGIVVSNSVLLVDFANNKLREGMPLEEAVVEAGRLRIRPIIMTSLATVIGLGPMALGLGEGSESNMPLARAVIGGLTVSTIMTLLFIPVLHVIARRRSAASLAETEGEVH